MKKAKGKYLEKIIQDYRKGKMNGLTLKSLKEAYISSTDKEKEIIELQYDDDEKELAIKSYHNDVRGIRKNVQYFFWFSIISFISTIIFVLFQLSKLK